MLYTFFFLVANTAIYMVYAAHDFAINDKTSGAENFVAAFLYLCK
jgi:hypothetical protein